MRDVPGIDRSVDEGKRGHMSATPGRFSELLRTLRRDAVQHLHHDGKLSSGEWLKLLLFTPGFQFVCSFRVREYIAHWPICGRFIRRWLWTSACKKFGSEIALGCRIGPGLYCPHPYGIVIGDSIIGEDVEILQGVTIGRVKRDTPQVPIIGDRCRIGAGAQILGTLEIGSRAVIGANAVVLKSVPSDAVAVGIPARIIIGSNLSQQQ